MNAENFFRVIVEKLNQQPFRTFVVELIDGQQLNSIDLSRSQFAEGWHPASSRPSSGSAGLRKRQTSR